MQASSVVTRPKIGRRKTGKSAVTATGRASVDQYMAIKRTIKPHFHSCVEPGIHSNGDKMTGVTRTIHVPHVVREELPDGPLDLTLTFLSMASYIDRNGRLRMSPLASVKVNLSVLSTIGLFA